jgi:hypothetical protein
VGRTVSTPQFGLGSDRVVADVEEKRFLYETTKSSIVDMESHRVGQVCQARNIPFFVLRAVCDPAGQAIPVSCDHAIDKNGDTRPLAVMAGLLRHPREFADLMRLKKQTKVAMAALEAALRNELPQILRSVEFV